MQWESFFFFFWHRFASYLRPNLNNVYCPFFAAKKKEKSFSVKNVIKSSLVKVSYMNLISLKGGC